MYKVLFSIAASFLFSTINAQDVKTARDFLAKSQFEKAAAAIDKAVAGTDANNPTAWVVKHTIYQALANSSEYKGSTANANLQGFVALAKARIMPKGDEAITKELGPNYTTVFNDYYLTFIKDGTSKMNATDYKEAYNNFINGLILSTYFYERKWIANALDTVLVFYTGYTAMKNNNFTSAEFQFKRLADANASGTDFQIAYGWLSNYYLADKKDAATAKNVCDKGLIHYPKDEYLLYVKVQIAKASGNIENVFTVYEETISKGNASFSDYLGYGAELYDYLFVIESNRTITNAAAKEKRLVEMLTKAISLKNNSAEANYIMGMYYTSKALDVDKEIKTTTDAAKKTELKNKADEWVLNSITYLETTASLFEAMPSKTELQKKHYKSAMQQLVNLYAHKGLSAKKTAAENKLKVL